MTDDTQQSAAAVELGPPEYFVEIATPYTWSSGPLTVIGDTHNPAEWPFTSLAAARAYAEREHIPGHSEKSTRVTYGVRYTQTLDSKQR